jgi:hypothetical protein
MSEIEEFQTVDVDSFSADIRTLRHQITDGVRSGRRPRGSVTCRISMSASSSGAVVVKRKLVSKLPFSHPELTFRTDSNQIPLPLEMT